MHPIGFGSGITSRRSVMNVFVAEWRPLGVPTPAGAALTNENLPGEAGRRAAHGGQVVRESGNVPDPGDAAGLGRPASGSGGCPNPNGDGCSRPNTSTQQIVLDYGSKPMTESPTDLQAEFDALLDRVMVPYLWLAGGAVDAAERDHLLAHVPPSAHRDLVQPGPHGAPGRTRPIRRSRLPFSSSTRDLTRDTSAGVF